MATDKNDKNRSLSLDITTARLPSKSTSHLHICSSTKGYISSLMSSHRRTSEEDRARIVESYENGEDFLALAHGLRIKRTTAYSIVNVYLKEGRCESLQQKGGRPKAIDDETLDFIVTLIEGNAAIGLRELQSTVREIWPRKPHFSVTSLSRALEGECISLKMSRDVPAERNSPATKDKRHHYAEWMMSEGMD